MRALDHKDTTELHQRLPVGCDLVTVHAGATELFLFDFLKELGHFRVLVDQHARGLGLVDEQPAAHLPTILELR